MPALRMKAYPGCSGSHHQFPSWGDLATLEHNSSFSGSLTFDNENYLRTAASTRAVAIIRRARRLRTNLIMMDTTKKLVSIKCLPNKIPYILITLLLSWTVEEHSQLTGIY